MAELPAELANLPPPALVEVISYETRYAELRDRLLEIFTAAGLDYDVGALETDPAQILLQVSAYQDVLLRQRINEAIRSWFLAYATSGDLDVLAQWYDVARMLDETDDEQRPVTAQSRWAQMFGWQMLRSIPRVAIPPCMSRSLPPTIAALPTGRCWPLSMRPYSHPTSKWSMIPSWWRALPSKWSTSQPMCGCCRPRQRAC